MAKGHNRMSIVGMQGSPIGQEHGLWDYIYQKSTARDPKYSVGDVHIVANRGIFVYSKSVGACGSGQAAEFTYTGYISITTFTTAAAVGARSITVPAATHAALTLDELRNGFCWIYDGTTNDVQFRQILGNAAADANAAFVMQLDGPLTEAVTTSSKIEVAQNPYMALRTSTSMVLGKAGVPAVKISGSGYYFWTQVGRVPSYCWVVPTSAVVGENGGMGCFWRHDGSLESADTALAVTTATYDTSQYAGHLITGNYSGVGPLFQLA